MASEGPDGYAGYSSEPSDYSRRSAFRARQGWYERSVSEAEALYAQAERWGLTGLQDMLNAHETQIDASVRRAGQGGGGGLAARRGRAKRATRPPNRHPSPGTATWRRFY